MSIAVVVKNNVTTTHIIFMFQQHEPKILGSTE